MENKTHQAEVTSSDTKLAKRPQLTKQLDPYLSKLKKVGFALWYEISRFRRLLIGGFTLFILLIVFNSLVLIAKPGDLFFTVKLYYEKALWPLDNTSATQQWNSLYHLSQDRTASYVLLASQSDCVQLELAEQELFSVWQMMHTQSAQLDIEAYAQYANYNLDRAKAIEGSGGTCAKSQPLVSATLGYQLMLASVNKLNVQEFDTQKQQAADKFAQQRDLLRTTPPKDQEQLTNINNLLLSANKLLGEVDKLLTDGWQLEALIKLQSADLALTNANQLILTKTDFQNWYGVIYTLCTLKPDAICDKATLAAKVNSVESLTNDYSRIDYGESFFRDYLALFIRKAE
jgi:hypothetical protein